ncbi:C-GCAxxG-C-C family protein [Prevotella sp.]|uniref:C-GCAxxG-C-C family protein n=2 Tax=Prevotella sp. TaxID=59823 RepID=UPI0027E39681|nr:C-GCAxxG-C-C family protein [Prevotella sp.]
METRKEIAAEKKRCGSHNCTQAVLCTYHDFAGMEEETIKNAGNAFAAGMGNMEGTCGAIVGAGIILGLATQDKAKSVKSMRQIMDKFKQRNGATQCKLLKGVGTGKVLRECPLCVADASEFLEEILEKEGKYAITDDE